MATPRTATTRLSTKGQMILPKAIRDLRQWDAGTELTVIDTPDGVLLNAAKPLFPRKTIKEVAGMLKYDGPTRTIEEMNEAIAMAVRERHARGRY